MLTVLTNLRSTKVLYHKTCIMHQKSCINHYASCIMHCRDEAEIWYADFTHKFKINQGVMVGRSPSLGWLPSIYNLFYHTRIWLSNIISGQEFGIETYLYGRWPLMEDKLRWKTTFEGVLEGSRDNRKPKFGMSASIKSRNWALLFDLLWFQNKRSS